MAIKALDASDRKCLLLLVDIGNTGTQSRCSAVNGL